ncbi:hypothetical protein [Paenibacillus puerhi]|uniref:hypothetical protein n=1 Tax=Paenibacillus puerhi TaxID=2692622 RepID=UPI001357BA74|nr:hypothetical protein [Paenibacillus puerhi]
MREFTAYLISSNSSADTLNENIESISVTSEESTWEESKIEGRPGGTFVQTPFNVTFGVLSSPVEKRDGKNLIYKVGAPIGYRFSVGTTEDKPMYLKESLEFSIEIIDVESQQVVWSGKTPALPPMNFPTWEKYEILAFTWNQYDLNGKPVAPGTYMARVVSPNSIQNSETETSKVHTQNLNLNTINRGGQPILIEQ